jgi:uncharacterized protein YlxP (DUF503 family)
VMADDFNAYLVFIMIEFYIPEANSLKRKRAVVKSIIDRIRNKFNASVAEVGHLHKWQRAAVAVSMTSNNRKLLEKNYSNIERLMRELGNIELLDMTIEWI